MFRDITLTLWRHNILDLHIVLHSLSHNYKKKDLTESHKTAINIYMYTWLQISVNT